MKAQKFGDCDPDKDGNRETDYDDYRINREQLRLEVVKDFIKRIARANYGHEACENDVKEREQERLPVVESDAAIDPRAMVVHVQDAPVAGRAMLKIFNYLIEIPLHGTSRV